MGFWKINDFYFFFFQKFDFAEQKMPLEQVKKFGVWFGLQHLTPPLSLRLKIL